MKLKARVKINGYANLACKAPSYWECLDEMEKMDYFLEHCDLVADLSNISMDDMFFSAQDIEEDIPKEKEGSTDKLSKEEIH